MRFKLGDRVLLRKEGLEYSIREICRNDKMYGLRGRIGLFREDELDLPTPDDLKLSNPKDAVGTAKVPVVTQVKLNQVVDMVVEELIRGVLKAKSDDYARDTTDRLANFALQARIDGVAPIDALRGNWLKHRASVYEAIEEAKNGKSRSIDWLKEKFGDSINYHILALAMILNDFHPDYFDKQA